MKWKKVLFSQELLINMLHQHFPGRLPKDMLIWGTRLNQQGNIEIFLFSDEFDNLAEGVPPELMDITFDEFSTI